MDATPDLKRLAPVENLAIDVISYAHGSVTPTLTNLYSKGKESFLKVYKIYSIIITRCLSLLLFFFSCKRELFLFVLSSNERTNRMILSEIVVSMMLLCRSISDRSRTRDELILFLKKPRESFENFFLFFRRTEPSSSGRRYLKVASKILIQAHTYMKNANESY